MATGKRHQVLVVGAGINGLSSALRIHESCGNVDVTVMAEKFSPNTTSDGAAGFWETFAVGNTDQNLANSLASDTYDYMFGLALSPLAKIAGIQQVSGYQIWDEIQTEELAFKDIVDGYRRMTDKELSRFPGAKDGRFFTSMTMDVTDHLKWLTDKLKGKGCRFIQRKIHSFSELSNDWDIVANCSGTGSYHLLKDDKVVPIRGQVFRVRAPWIKQFCVDLTITNPNKPPFYVLPNFDTVVVGGTHQEGNWNEKVDKKDSKAIWDAATRIMPSLKGATILKEWVGLRPGRDTLRLESELMNTGARNRQLPVVHNYGHGGCGITLHWGCAKKTAEMVSNFIHDIETGSLRNKHSTSSKL